MEVCSTHVVWYCVQYVVIIRLNTDTEKETENMMTDIARSCRI